MKKNNKKGFTLVELLVVIVILAILAITAFTIVGNRVEEARRKAVVNDVDAVVKAFDLCVTDSSNGVSGALAGCALTNGASSSVDITTLVGKYLTKQDTSKFAGSIIKCSSGYKVSLMSGGYSTGNTCKDPKDIKESDITKSESYASSCSCS